MISIEAYRAAIGRFSRKSRYISYTGKSEKKEWGDVAFFIFLAYLQVVLYGLVISTISVYFSYIMLFLTVAVTYGYSYWIVKNGCDLLCITIQKLVKRNELMSKPAPPNGVKVHTLIPCNYLGTYVFDGRCNCLDTTFVLDGGAGETQGIRINNRKLITKFTRGVHNLLCSLCNWIIFSSFMCISLDVISRMNDAYYNTGLNSTGLHDL